MEDSEPLFPGASGVASVLDPRGSVTFGSIKALVVLFLLFLLVISGPFFRYIVSPLGGGLLEPNLWGVVLQGSFLVLFYAVFLHLADLGVL